MCYKSCYHVKPETMIADIIYNSLDLNLVKETCIQLFVSTAPYDFPKVLGDCPYTSFPYDLPFA